MKRRHRLSQSVRFTPESGHVSALAYVCVGPIADIPPFIRSPVKATSSARRDAARAVATLLMIVETGW